MRGHPQHLGHAEAVSPVDAPLRERLDRLDRARRRSLVAVALGWTLAGVLLGLNLAVGADAGWDLSAGVRIGLATAALLGSLVVITWCIQTWRRASDLRTTAQRLEQREGRGDGVWLTAVELSPAPGSHPAPGSDLAPGRDFAPGSEALRRRAVERGAVALRAVPNDTLVDRPALRRALVSLAVVVLFTVASVGRFERAWQFGMPRWVTPWRDVPAYTPLDFAMNLDPNPTIAAGPATVHLQLSHVDPEANLPTDVTIVWRTADGVTAEAPMRLPDLEPDLGSFTHHWSQVDDALSFVIRTPLGRSERFELTPRPPEPEADAHADEAEAEAIGPASVSMREVVASIADTQPSRTELVERVEVAADRERDLDAEDARPPLAKALRDAADTGSDLAGQLVTLTATRGADLGQPAAVAEALQAWADAARRLAQARMSPARNTNAASPVARSDALREADERLLQALDTLAAAYGLTGLGGGGSPPLTDPPEAQTATDPLDPLLTPPPALRDDLNAPARVLGELQDVPLEYRELAAAYFRRLAEGNAFPSSQTEYEPR
jgi:hypothetical protein